MHAKENYSDLWECLIVVHPRVKGIRESFSEEVTGIKQIIMRVMRPLEPWYGEAGRNNLT